MRKPTTYWVIVGNVGTVHSGSDEAEARVIYEEYVCMSRSGFGRAGDASVVLLEGEEISSAWPGLADPAQA